MLFTLFIYSKNLDPLTFRVKIKKSPFLFGESKFTVSCNLTYSLSEFKIL